MPDPSKRPSASKSLEQIRIRHLNHSSVWFGPVAFPGSFMWANQPYFRRVPPEQGWSAGFFNRGDSLVPEMVQIFSMVFRPLVCRKEEYSW